MKAKAALALLSLVVIGGVLVYRVCGFRDTNPSRQDAPKAPPSSQVVATYVPSIADGLITNEYVFYNADDPAAPRSADWAMTSGSLFAKGGNFWTGHPDSCDPNATSRTCTDSNVFRLNTRRSFGGNIKVSLALKQDAVIANSGCDAKDTCWHGTHVWLRYQSEFNLYYVSINRADGNVVIKRKVPCGDDNSGTYFVLGQYEPDSFRVGDWNRYATTIQTNRDQSVTIKLYDEAKSATRPVAEGTDKGGTNPNWSRACSTSGKYPSSHYAPITATGAVGVRGDFANFEFKNFSVSTF